jgi:hypothetical protein
MIERSHAFQRPYISRKSSELPFDGPIVFRFLSRAFFLRDNAHLDQSRNFIGVSVNCDTHYLTDFLFWFPSGPERD